MNETDFDADDWMGLNWSEWLSPRPEKHKLSTITTDPGFYRVRHTNRKGLEYIGETGRNLRDRIRFLRNGIYSKEMPYRDPHVAAPCLWSVRDAFDGKFEVSYADPEIAEKKKHRKGIEAQLIAIYRREGQTDLTANFGKFLSGYKSSTMSRKGIKGDKIEDYEGEHKIQQIESVDWTNIEDITCSDWAGLDWSETHRMEERKQVDIPDDPGHYKIWHSEKAPPLAYIGQSKNVKNRIYSHHTSGEYEDEALFSFAIDKNSPNRAKRLAIETDLIGIYYYVEDEPPTKQF